MKVGIIGCGLMGQRRARHIDPDDKIIGGYDLNYSGSWEWPRVGLEQLIDASDVLVVATPHHLLAKYARMCVRAGKHILLEKPCATRPAELIPVIADARAAGAMIIPGFTLRHYPGIEMARSFIESRTPRYMRALYGHPGRPGYEKEWRADPYCGGGELLDQGVHLIDLTHFLLGPSTLKDCWAGRGAWGAKVEDTVAMRLETTRGTALLQASWVEPRPVFRLEVICAEATLTVEGLGAGYGEHVYDTLERHDRGHCRASWADPRQMALRNEWASFKATVASGESYALEEDALRVLEIVQKAREAQT